jgi:DNA-binding MarR family transcriptional regulator
MTNNRVMATRSKTVLARDTYLALVRAQDRLASQAADLLKQHGLTTATYNVLRILRGAGGAALSCSEVGERLIHRVPDVTRLLDRMERDGWVRRERASDDRRVVRTQITAAGRKAVDALDGPVLELHAQQFAGLAVREIEALEAALEHLARPAPTAG